MIRLILARHGITDWNLQKRYNGLTDIPLAPEGRRQAERIGLALNDHTIDLAYVSNMQRTRETAEIILKERGVKISKEPRFREISFGEWEGLTFAEINERYPEEVRAWIADPVHTAPPGGESLSELAARVLTALRELLNEGEKKNILLVTHGGPAQVILTAALRMGLSEYWRCKFTPGAWAILEFYDEQGILCQLINDT